MTQIQAIYEGGVFKPLGDVHLRDKQLVQLDIEPLEKQEAGAWLNGVREMHRQFIERRGFLPDTTADIAADRTRDE
jgi:predicted DNA-binding antitoxin AbrB/MazE fold protein